MFSELGPRRVQPEVKLQHCWAMADRIELSRADFLGEAAFPAPRGRVGVLVAGALALAASAGLAWWTLSPDRTETAPPPAAPPAAAPAPPQPLRYAPDEPDPAQVKRAHREAQSVYVAGGPQALVRASAACAKAAPADPGRLDYCLGLDTYAREIVSGAADPAAADWFADQGRDLALARTALPAGSDAANRLAQVEALAQAVLPKPVIAKPKPKAKPKPHAKAHVKAAKRPPAHRPHVRRPAAHVTPDYPKAAPQDPAAEPDFPFPPGEPFGDPPH
jgi:hypothetical protein